MTSELRIERLERQHRLLKWTLITICGFAVCGAVIGQATPEALPDTIRVKSFVVVDDAGNESIKLAFEKDAGGVILIRSEKGDVTHAVGSMGGNGILLIANSKGKFVTTLGAANGPGR